MTLSDAIAALLVATDRLRVHGYEYRGGGQSSDLNLANRALIALANVHERLANSVPVEQAKMEGMGEE